MSVSVGISKVSETFLRIFKAFVSPMPVKLSRRLLLAFLKLPLKIYGILSESVMDTIFSAISKAIVSPSIAHGPAIRKKLSESECLIFGIRFIFITNKRILKQRYRLKPYGYSIKTQNIISVLLPLINYINDRA